MQAARKRDAAAYLPPDTDPTVLAGYKAQRKIILDDLEGTDTPIGMIHWGTGNSVTLYFIRPLSRGSIIINSTNILVAPLVDFRTVTDPTDFDLFISLFKKSREIMNAPSMKILGPKEDLPFSEEITDDATLKEIFSTIMNPTTAHECCTASMRPKKHGGVVDKDMKVYGVKGLRVIDISYWPMVLTAAPTATMYASAEKVRISKRSWRASSTDSLGRLRTKLRRPTVWPDTVKDEQTKYHKTEGEYQCSMRSRSEKRCHGSGINWRVLWVGGWLLSGRMLVLGEC